MHEDCKVGNFGYFFRIFQTFFFANRSILIDRFFSFKEESMTSAETVPALAVLPQIFYKLTDPRDPRGVRHPFATLCSLAPIIIIASACPLKSSRWQFS